MIDMYEKYGYYKDDIQAITLKVSKVCRRSREIMETLRNDLLQRSQDIKYFLQRDYKKDTVKIWKAVK